MGFKVGIGGRVGPFRAGISTRGVGGGVGPFNAGTSWRGSQRRSSSGGGQVVGLILLLMLLTVVFAWPYMLATYTAVSGFGVVENSRQENVIGWVAEGAYLALLACLAITVAVHLHRRDSARFLAFQEQNGRRQGVLATRVADWMETVAPEQAHDALIVDIRPRQVYCYATADERMLPLTAPWPPEVLADAQALYDTVAELTQKALKPAPGGVRLIRLAGRGGYYLKKIT